MIRYPETTDAIYQLYKDDFKEVRDIQWLEEDYLGKTIFTVQFYTISLDTVDLIKMTDDFSKIKPSCKRLRDKTPMNLKALIPILNNSLLDIGDASIGDTFQVNP